MFALRLALQARALTGPLSRSGAKLAAASSAASHPHRNSQARAAMRSFAAAGDGGGGDATPPAARTGLAEGEAAPQQQAASSAARVRDYPEEPRVGVGVVILRSLPPAAQPEVLLIRRAKEPSNGKRCVVGGGVGPCPALCSWRSMPQCRRVQTQPADACVEVVFARRMLSSLCCHPTLSAPGSDTLSGLWCFPGGSLELGESLVDCAVRETLEETGLQLRNAAQEGAAAGGAAPWVACCRCCWCCCGGGGPPCSPNHLPPTRLHPFTPLLLSSTSRPSFCQKPPLPCRHPHAFHPSAAGELFSDTLAFPSPVSSSDAMMRDPDGRLLFHYAIVNYAAVPEVGVGPRPPLHWLRPLRRPGRPWQGTRHQKSPPQGARPEQAVLRARGSTLCGRGCTTAPFKKPPCSLPALPLPSQDPQQTPVPADDVDGAQWWPVAQLRGLKGAQGWAEGRAEGRCAGRGCWQGGAGGGAQGWPVGQLRGLRGCVHQGWRGCRQCNVLVLAAAAAAAAASCICSFKVQPSEPPPPRRPTLQTWCCTVTAWRSGRCGNTVSHINAIMAVSRRPSRACCGDLRLLCTCCSELLRFATSW